MEGSQNALTEKPERHPATAPKNQETAMNAMISTLYRDLTCAAAALLISLVIGASFVQSTATPPGTASAVPARQA